MEIKDHLKSNKNKDIQLQCKSSLTLCIRVLDSKHKQNTSFHQQMFTKNCECIHWPDRIKSATRSYRRKLTKSQYCPSQKKKIELAWAQWEHAMTTTLRNKYYSGHHTAMADQRTLEEEKLEKNGKQALSTAGGKWKWQHKTAKWRGMVCGLRSTGSDKA